MIGPHRDEAQSGDQGVALILALFALLLISSVGAAILFMSANESSIVSNQRAYTTAWEAAKGGLEEARERISKGDVSYFGASLPTDATHILYVINPACVSGSSETVDPAVSTNAYFDTEYNTEWGQPITTAGLTVTKVNSDMLALTQPASSCASPTLPSGPAFKWVRVTVKTEASANQDVDQDGLANDTTTTIYYDNVANRQTMVAGGPPPLPIIYRATALAVLSNGTTRMFQYDLKPGMPLPPLPGALTVCGAGGVSGLTTGPPSTFPSSAPWKLSGTDQAGAAAPVPGLADCTPAAQAQLDPGGWKAPSSVTGAGGSPSVVDTSGTMGACLQSVSCLQGIVAGITAGATAINPPTPCSNMGTSTLPAVTVITGDMSCSGSPVGYGLLLVEGNLAFSGKPSFNGIILVIGKGSFCPVSGSGNGQLNGGVFLANIDTGVVGDTPGTPTLCWNGGGTGSINFNSADISLATQAVNYKVLAAREINQ